MLGREPLLQSDPTEWRCSTSPICGGGPTPGDHHTRQSKIRSVSCAPQAGGESANSSSRRNVMDRKTDPGDAAHRLKCPTQSLLNILHRVFGLHHANWSQSCIDAQHLLPLL